MIMDDIQQVREVIIDNINKLTKDTANLMPNIRVIKELAVILEEMEDKLKIK